MKCGHQMRVRDAAQPFPLASLFAVGSLFLACSATNSFVVIFNTLQCPVPMPSVKKGSWTDERKGMKVFSIFFLAGQLCSHYNYYFTTLTAAVAAALLTLFLIYERREDHLTK